MNRQIDTIIFDLDGTLYEDRHHFDYYADRVKKKLPESIQEEFEETYQKVVNDQHPLQPGRFYDLLEDKLIVQIHQEIKEVYHWNGKLVDPQEVNVLYPEGYVHLDRRRFFSIGDYWSVPIIIARHFGFQRKDVNSAFTETRRYMMSEKFTMNPVKGFRETLLELKEHINLVLLTNSPQPDSDVLLIKLGLDNVFAKKIFNAKKPSHTTLRFTEIRDTFETQYPNMLSVGDNYVNEILPARDLGLETIYIDNHHTGLASQSELTVHSITEVIPILKELIC